jgi:hypothetical protein
LDQAQALGVVQGLAQDNVVFLIVLAASGLPVRPPDSASVT